MPRPANEVSREEFEEMLPRRRRRQPERAFQARVLELAARLGWRHWHDAATNAPRRCPSCGQMFRMRRNAPGWLDLVLIRRPRLVWVELKAEGGKVSQDQQLMIDELRACGQEVYVWWPDDWDTIAGVLA